MAGMNKLITLASLLMISLSALGEDVVARWSELNAEYASAAETGNFSAAYDVAMVLVGMDPSDTHAKLCLVLASIQLGREPPSWLLGESWTNATPEDRINRVAAEVLLDLLNKQRQAGTASPPLL